MVNKTLVLVFSIMFLLATDGLAATIPVGFPSVQPAELDCEPIEPHNHCMRVGVFIEASTTTTWAQVKHIDQMPIYFPEFHYHSTIATEFAPGLTYSVTYLPGDVTGIYEITSLEPGLSLGGRQISPHPLKTFEFIHRYIPVEGGLLSDEVIYYTIPLGFIGRLINVLVVKRRLRGMLLQAHTILKRRAEYQP